MTFPSASLAGIKWRGPNNSGNQNLLQVEMQEMHISDIMTVIINIIQQYMYCAINVVKATMRPMTVNTRNS